MPQGITVNLFGHSRDRGGRGRVDARSMACTTDDASVGPDWWMASDGNWYRPEQHPDYMPSPEGPAVAPGPSAADAAVSVPAAALEKVRRLGRMLDAGRLSDYEFQQMRKEILGL
jgi:hypothetical protein